MKVNWCPLWTVLTNDEVSEGLSIRGGYPGWTKVMRQWSLRVSAYAQRLLDGLEKIELDGFFRKLKLDW